MLFDVVIVSDFRFPGGTSTAISHEIRALHGAGYSVGLAQKRAPLLKKDRDFHPHIAACLLEGQAVLVAAPRARVECRLAVLHNPLVFTEPDPILPSIRTEQAVLVADQPVTDASGAPYYDVWAVQHTVAKLAGAVRWAPISPLSRQNMEDARLPFAVLDSDWTHVLFNEDWICDRSLPCGARPALGRHSRPEKEKWPATREDILQVYPEGPEFDVRLLGVGSYLREIVGEPLPANWTTYEFGEIEPTEFLRSIDFFVYFHHPHWVEGFGRTIAEAAASGAVVILPDYLRTTFGDAALYREPADVLPTVREFHADRNAYAMQSRIARQAIDRSYGPGRLLQRVGRLIGEPDPKAQRAREEWLRAGRSGQRKRGRTRRPPILRNAYDVVHLGDLQTRRESAWRIANLVRVEAAKGYLAGLVNVAVDAERATTIHPLIDELARDRSAVPIHPSTPIVLARLLVIHTPTELWSARRRLPRLPRIVADKVIAVKDTSAKTRLLPEQDRFLKSLFGSALKWAATHEEVYESISGVKGIRLERRLWRPAIERIKTLAATRPRRPLPVLGCIWADPRESETKVAERVARFVSASEDEAAIRLMDPPVKPGTLDDFWPDDFEIFSGSELSPSKFLASLDFLAALPFGALRAPPEEIIAWSMAHGIPVILPPALKSRIGDGPVYAKASDIARVATDLHADRGRMTRLKQRTAKQGRLRYPAAAHIAELRRLVGAPAPRSRPAARQRDPRRRVLFLSSNGVGLGHLTRLLAVARRMPDRLEPVFATLSQAMPVVEQAGYPVEYIPFHVYANSDPHEWNNWLARQLSQIMRFHDSKAVVFDGSVPYGGLIRAIAGSDTKAAWIRRGMWQETQGNREGLARERFFDLVIEPGDIADSVDRGATVDSRAFVHKVPPISLLDACELHDRATAAARLGLDPSRPAVLIQLGSGWNRELATMMDAILAAIAERPEIQPVLLEWLIAGTKVDLWRGVPRLKGFPATKYYNAFDFTISAAGYNSFNEIISFGLPAIFIANEHPMMDDQAGRASFAADNEAAFQLPETQLDGIGPLLDLMLDENVRLVMKTNCAHLARPNGAALAAGAITELLG